MSITVEHGKDNTTTHTSAEKWHIDDHGRLHVVGDNGNAAAYNQGYWSAVYQEGPRSPKITAVATLYSKEAKGDGQTALAFQADYNDERNKEWAKYTPGLGVQMTVIDSVADNFEQGSTYLLNFVKQD